MTASDPPLRSRANRRTVLRAVAGGSAAGLAGCSIVGPWGTTRSSAISIEYVDVAGARSRETFQPVVAELGDLHDRPIAFEFVEIPYGNMRSQLQTRVGGGDAPDVAAIDQIWLGTFLDAGNLLELDEVADEVDVDDYLDPFVAAARADGHLYAVPITTDVRGMYWNRRAFERAGLDPESPPETWRDLYDVAARLHDPPERYGAIYFVVGGRWTVNLFAAGGQVLDETGTEPRFQEPPGIEAATFVDQLYNGHEVGPPDPPYRDGAAVAREFLQGRHAIAVVEGSWLDYFWRNLGNDDEEMVERFGFAATPRPGDGEHATMSGGHLWGCFRDTDHPEVVRDFVRIAAGREFKRHLAIETGEVPTRESLQDDGDIWDGVLYGDTVRELLAGTRLRPVRNWSVVAAELDTALQRVAFDEADPAPALEAAADAVRTDLR